MATSAITRRCVFSAFAQCRNAHTNSNSSGLPKKGTFSSINTALKNNSLTSRRSLQSIAQTKDVKGRRRHAINDAIDVGAKNIASDPCLSSVTLGELREAKYLSQKLQEKIMRWIWEGESWSVFAENDIQITRVKLLPDFKTLKIYWSATGGHYVDKTIQRLLDESVSVDIEERMKSQNLPGEIMPRIDFVADTLHLQASELASGKNMQHPPLSHHDKDTFSELTMMKTQTGISSLKMVEPTLANGANLEHLEEDFIERSQIQGLDYKTVLAEILNNPSCLRY